MKKYIILLFSIAFSTTGFSQSFDADKITHYKKSDKERLPKEFITGFIKVVSYEGNEAKVKIKKFNSDGEVDGSEIKEITLRKEDLYSLDNSKKNGTKYLFKSPYKDQLK